MPLRSTCECGCAEFEDRKEDAKCKVKQEIKKERSAGMQQPSDQSLIKGEVDVKFAQVKDEKADAERKPVFAGAVVDLTSLVNVCSPDGVQDDKSKKMDTAAGGDVVIMPDTDEAQAGPSYEDVKPVLKDMVIQVTNNASRQSGTDEAQKRAELLEKLQRRKAIKMEGKK